MPKNTLTKELQTILTILKQEADGMKIGDIIAALPEPMARRTLLRRLSKLKAMEAIISSGEKSNTRYIINNTTTALTFSTNAQALKADISRPLQQRKPVAYKVDFLYRYQPNQTYYLPKKIREHLKAIGQQFNHQLEPGTYVKRVLHKLLIDFSWNSSRLEGNTYSLLETERLLEYGVAADGKQAFETQMVLNHKDAIEFMIKHVDQPGVHPHVVLNIHALLSNNLLANPKARGQLRQIPVNISQTVYHPPEIPQLIEECFQYLLHTAEQIIDPFEQAFFMMVQLPYLQPFEDVNKRVSRLIANIPLIKNNFSPLSFIDVPKNDYTRGLLAIYELNKTELMRDIFVWAYERSAQQYQVVQDTLGEPNLIYMRFKNELFELINLIVSNNIRGKAIIDCIQAWSEQHIEASQQAAFIALTEKEIASLHEGNIAIYQIQANVFAQWKIN